MKNKIKIGIGIIGIGYEGFRGFISLLTIEEALRNEGIEIGGVIVIEPDPDRKKDCERISKVLFFPVELFSSLDEFFYFIERKRDDFLKKFNCLIFYDASPTKWHSKNLKRIYTYNLSIPIYYFGEKPISTDKLQLHVRLSGEEFYCNFTELQNSAYLTLRNYLDETNFQINSLKFWRASSIGFQKLIDPTQRAGITGGALEDKGIHDIALTIDLLGGVKKLELKKQKIKENTESSVIVISPEIKPKEIHFMPANLYSLFRPTPLFIDTRDEKTIDEIFKIEDTFGKEYKKYWYFAADSEFKMKIIWSLQDERQIEAKYYFSWVGLSEEVKKEIEKEISIKLPEHWLGKKEQSVPNSVPIIGGIRYLLTEARLMIVEGVNKKDNKNEKIICNLLRKPSLGIKNLWIYRIIQGENKVEPKIDIKENEFQFSQNFLARMFYNVILSVVEHVKKNKEKDRSGGENSYEKVGKDVTCWAHLIIAEAREKAFKEKLKVNQLKKIESDSPKKSLIKKLSKESMERYKNKGGHILAHFKVPARRQAGRSLSSLLTIILIKLLLKFKWVLIPVEKKSLSGGSASLDTTAHDAFKC